MPVKIIKNLAPPGHRPTNAQLDISPFHIKISFATSTDLSNPYPTLPISDIPVDGHPSTLTAHDLAEKKFTLAPKDLALTLPPQGRNFAGLAKNAPFSYETLRQRGMLDKDGSPTHKYASKKRLEELMSEQRKWLIAQLGGEVEWTGEIIAWLHGLHNSVSEFGSVCGTALVVSGDMGRKWV
jgi:hypothetical protein